MDVMLRSQVLYDYQTELKTDLWMEANGEAVKQQGLGVKLEEESPPSPSPAVLGQTSGDTPETEGRFPN